jgi:hypothetical protein
MPYVGIEPTVSVSKRSRRTSQTARPLGRALWRAAIVLRFMYFIYFVENSMHWLWQPNTGLDHMFTLTLAEVGASTPLHAKVRHWQDPNNKKSVQFIDLSESFISHDFYGEGLLTLRPTHPSWKTTSFGSWQLIQYIHSLSYPGVASHTPTIRGGIVVTQESGNIIT